MADLSTIGILGGMGPEATNRLCALITALTPAARDQDHIPVITYNNPRIPGRVEALRGRGESPLPELARTARVLESAGADFLLMPCNLAHFYAADIQKAVGIPLLNIIEETTKFVIENHPGCRRVGLIASTPTIQCGLYERAFQLHEVSVVSPDDEEQESKVMRAIYGPRGLKSGHKAGPRALLMEAALGLVSRGAEVVVAGCTEVSLVMTQKNNAFAVVDPLETLARVAVKRAMSGRAAAVGGVGP